MFIVYIQQKQDTAAAHNKTLEIKNGRPPTFHPLLLQQQKYLSIIFRFQIK